MTVTTETILEHVWMTAFGCNGLKQDRAGISPLRLDASVFKNPPTDVERRHLLLLDSPCRLVNQQRIGVPACLQTTVSCTSCCSASVQLLWEKNQLVKPFWEAGPPAWQAETWDQLPAGLRAFYRKRCNVLEPRQRGGFATPCLLTSWRCAWVNSASPLVVAAPVRKLKQEVVAGWLADAAKLPGFSCGRTSRESTQVGHSDLSAASGKTHVWRRDTFKENCLSVQKVFIHVKQK